MLILKSVILNRYCISLLHGEGFEFLEERSSDMNSEHIVFIGLMFVPCIARLSINNRGVVWNHNTPIHRPHNTYII
jgi:hypothetical protein